MIKVLLSGAAWLSLCLHCPLLGDAALTSGSREAGEVLSCMEMRWATAGGGGFLSHGCGTENQIASISTWDLQGQSI